VYGIDIASGLIAGPVSTEVHLEDGAALVPLHWSDPYGGQSITLKKTRFPISSDQAFLRKKVLLVVHLFSTGIAARGGWDLLSSLADFRGEMGLLTNGDHVIILQVDLDACCPSWAVRMQEGAVPFEGFNGNILMKLCDHRIADLTSPVIFSAEKSRQEFLLLMERSSEKGDMVAWARGEALGGLVAEELSDSASLHSCQRKIESHPSARVPLSVVSPDMIRDLCEENLPLDGSIDLKDQDLRAEIEAAAEDIQSSILSEVVAQTVADRVMSMKKVAA